MQSQLKIKEFKEVQLTSELLCVCDKCKTPFITVCINYSKKSKVKCEQCDTEKVSIVRVKVCSANLSKK